MKQRVNVFMMKEVKEFQIKIQNFFWYARWSL